MNDRSPAASADGMTLIEHLPFDTDDGIASRARIGLLVLATDFTIEHEWRAIMAGLKGVALYESRILNDAQITPETLRAMDDLVRQGKVAEANALAANWTRDNPSDPAVRAYLAEPAPLNPDTAHFEVVMRATSQLSQSASRLPCTPRTDTFPCFSSRNFFNIPNSSWGCVSWRLKHRAWRLGG